MVPPSTSPSRRPARCWPSPSRRTDPWGCRVISFGFATSCPRAEVNRHARLAAGRHPRQRLRRALPWWWRGNRVTGRPASYAARRAIRASHQPCHQPRWGKPLHHRGGRRRPVHLSRPDRSDDQPARAIVVATRSDDLGSKRSGAAGPSQQPAAIRGTHHIGVRFVTQLLPARCGNQQKCGEDAATPPPPSRPPRVRTAPAHQTHASESR
jgi:hypothetical protein